MFNRQHVLANATSGNIRVSRLLLYVCGPVLLVAIIGMLIARAQIAEVGRTVQSVRRQRFPSLHEVVHVVTTPRQWAETTRAVVAILVAACSLTLWCTTMQWVDVRAMNNLGLVSVLPIPSYVALGGLTLGFCLTLGALRSLRTPVVLMYVLALVFMLYATPALVEQAPRFSVTYWLAGHTEYVIRTGTVNPFFDAYFNWPGFFIFTGLLTKVAGLQSVLAFAPWASMVYNLMYLAPMYIIFTTATKDRRTIWLGIWFFYITDWVWQDYFDPQGLNFFLYLTIIAILLSSFKTVQATALQTDIVLDDGTELPPPETSWLHEAIHAPEKAARAAWEKMKTIRLSRLWKPQSASSRLAAVRAWSRLSDLPSTPEQQRQRRALLIALIIIFAFSVFSHPMTPFFVLLSVSALTLFGRITPRWLPIMLAFMIIGWDFTAATPYLAGHLASDLSSFGNIQVVTSANVTDRLAAGDPQHHFISQVRVMATAAIWGLALLGAALRWRRGAKWHISDSTLGAGSLFSHDITFVLLVVAPAFMVIAQPYGGEMAMRYYLFSLPVVSFFAASAFRTRILIAPSHRARFASVSYSISGLAVSAACLLMLTGFMFARYGNESADYVTYNEFNAVSYLYHVAPPHSLLLQGWAGTPWRYRDLEVYVYSPIYPGSGHAAAIRAHDVSVVVNRASDAIYPETYVIITRSQKAQAAMFNGIPPSAFDTLVNSLLASGKFELVYSNPDAEILMYVHPKRIGASQTAPPRTDVALRGIS